MYISQNCFDFSSTEQVLKLTLSDLPFALYFLLPIFSTKTGHSRHTFWRPDVTLQTMSKHWRKLKALTLNCKTHPMTSCFSCPPTDFRRYARRSIYSGCLPTVPQQKKLKTNVIGKRPHEIKSETTSHLLSVSFCDERTARVCWSSSLQVRVERQVIPENRTSTGQGFVAWTLTAATKNIQIVIANTVQMT